MRYPVDPQIPIPPASPEDKTRIETLVQQCLTAQGQAIAFKDMVSLVEAFGFTLDRINGSHHIFTHPDIPELVKLYDALHLAFAQSASVDIFLTTDDLLLRKAKQYPEVVTIPVENPVVWLMKLLQEENVNHETS